MFPREAVLSQLRPRLWNFVRSSAELHETGTFVEAIWQLTPGRFEELVATHLGLLDSTGETLDVCAAALARLPSSLGRRFEEFDGYVHGPVDWPRTQLRRLTTATPTLYVCRPVERRYETPAARLVHAALTATSHLATRSGRRAAEPISTDEPAEQGLPINLLLYGRSDRARLLLRHPKMRGLGRPKAPRGEVLRRLLSRRPELRVVSDFLARHDASFEGTNEHVLKEVFSEHLLVPSADDDLFELLVAFELADALLKLGCDECTAEPDLWGDGRAVAPICCLQHPHLGRIEIFWDRSLWRLFPATAHMSRLRSIESAAGMRAQSVRPDVTAVFSDLDRVFLMEVKATSKDGVAAERRGIVEALAYLKDAEDFLAGHGRPQAAVVGWNATGQPPDWTLVGDAVPEVIVADQTAIAEVAKWVLRAAASDGSSG